MPLALLLLTLASPGAPLRPDLYETHLAAPAGVLLPTVASSRRGQVFDGVRLTVSGAICTVLGGAIAAPGIYFLLRAGAQTGSDRTVSTVLGWTFAGIGGVLGLVGLPLLIVGIVKLATRPGSVSLGLDQRGQLAVRF